MEKDNSGKSKPTILTCAQPTGMLTIGNYLGAVRNWSAMLDQNDCYFGIVDLHAITTPSEPSTLRQNVYQCVAQYIACGLDPAKCHQFVQSHVMGHTELAWVLTCITPIGELQRMTQFKDKAAKLGFKVAASNEADDLKFEHHGARAQASINAGLLCYPVLMAADILLYDATHVPVGDDQKQHLELCRDIAQKFNNDFEVENFLQVPEPLIQKEFSRIMSLKDGSKKMSKSELSDLSRINLTDDKDQIINKIKKAKTDPLPMPQDIKELDERLEAKNLLGIYSSLTNSTLENSVKHFAGKNFSEFKEQLAEELVNKIEPISNEIKKLLGDKSYLDKILLDGVEKANLIASKKIERIKEIVGF